MAASPFAHIRSPALWAAVSWPSALGLRALTGFIAHTVRVSVLGPGAGYSEPALYVNWHRYQPYLCMHHGEAGRWLMVSKDPYMEPVVRWNRLHGLRIIRGGSGDGGQQALRDMVQRLTAGDSAFMAVDGPAGPAFRVKRGCVEIARAARVPIIPVGYACKRARFHPRRWDHWLFMRPFDRITVCYGTPLFFSQDEPLEQALERVAGGLRGVCNSRPDPNAPE